MTGRHALRTPPSRLDRAEPALWAISTAIELAIAALTAMAVLWLVIYALAGGTL